MSNATSPTQAALDSPIDISWESVTPSRANLWIKNTRETEFAQRPASQGTIKKYIGEINRGAWHNHTGDMIRIGHHGGHEVVVDGQHRLLAIIGSKTPLDMLVARNVPLDAFKYIDQGNNRTLKDVMDCAGWSDTTTISSAGRYLWVHAESGSPFGAVKAERNLSAGSLFDWVAEYEPSLRTSWERNMKLVREARKGIKMSESIMLFLWVKLSASDPILAREVYEYFASPAVNTAPSSNFGWAVKMIDEIQFKVEGMKKAGLKTRSDEHRDPCTLAILAAWELHKNGADYSKVGPFKKAISSKGKKLWSVLS